MSAIALALGWWVSVVLPVVIGLSLASLIAFPWIARASWRFQSWVFLGLLVAFALVLVGPWYPRSAVTMNRLGADGVNLVGGERKFSAVSRNDSVSLSEWLPWLGGVWMLGVLASLRRLGRSHWALRKLVRRSELLEGVSLDTYFGKSVRHLLERKRVAVFRTDAGVSPCCLGSVRRKVLFPSAILEGLNREERDLVLRHEILHLSSCDVLLLYFQRLMEALYWWNPVVAKISESLSQSREGLCDEAIIAGGTARQTYAELLVQLGEHSSLRMSAAVSGSPAYNGLKMRLERILRGKRPSGRQAWCGSVIALGVCASAVFAVVQVGQVVPKPVSIAATQNGLKLTDFPQLKLVGIAANERMVIFEDGRWVALGETIDVWAPLPTPGLTARLTYLGVIDGSIRLRWSSAKGVLEQEIEMAPEVGPVIRGPLDPVGRPYRPMIYDTPPVRPEDPLKEVDGDPSVAKRGLRDRSGFVDGRRFEVVSVNLVGSESSKKTFDTGGDPNPAGLLESAIQTWIATERHVLLKRVDEKPTPIERGYYDDPEFSRQHVERGLKEVQQRWPGQLVIEDLPER